MINISRKRLRYLSHNLYSRIYGLFLGWRDQAMRLPLVGAEVRSVIGFVWQCYLRICVLVSWFGQVGFCAVLASRCL